MVTLNLVKGQNLVLDKEISKFQVGAGWDTNQSVFGSVINTLSGGSNNYDLDLSIIPVTAEGKLNGQEEVCYFGNQSVMGGAIAHVKGDNTTGEGEGDDEVVQFDLPSIPAHVARMMLVVNIYRADEKGQNFGQVSNAFVRIINPDNEHEICRYDLTEDFSTETAVVFGEIYRHNGGWKFKAVGEGYKCDLNGLIRAVTR